MPKKSLDDIVKERKALEKELDDYEKDRSKIEARLKKVSTDYDTTRGGLDEGLKVIDDLKSQVKEAFTTWEKMLSKLETIKGNFEEIAKIVKASTPNVEKFGESADDLSKALASCRGDVKDLKDEDAELKKVRKNAERLRFDFKNLYDSATTPCVSPKKPVLEIA